MTKKLPQIQLTVNKHGQLVQTIAKPIHDGNLPITLEEFQVQANAALTQMIEDLDELGQMCKYNIPNDPPRLHMVVSLPN